jgi:heptosyltransferase-1
LSAIGSITRIVSKVALAPHRFNGRGKVTLKNVSSILCVELTRMGDVVSMLPGLAILKRAAPHATLSVIVDKKYETLLRYVPAVDSAMGFEDTATVRGLVGAVNRLRSSRYDVVVSMSSAQRNVFVSSLVRGKAKVGYFDPTDTLTPFLDDAEVEGFGISPTVSIDDRRGNIYDRSMNICASLGLDYRPPASMFQIAPDERLRLGKQLQERGFNLRVPYVIVHPYAGWKYRRWRSSEVVELVSRLLHDGLNVVVVGDREDSLQAGMFNLEGQGRLFSFFGLPLDELLVLIEETKVFVGTDSGPLHLAAALDVPIVGLYGPAHPKFTAPAVKNSSFIFHEMECSPCTQKICVHPDRTCMDVISADEVYSKVVQLLNVS